MKNQDFVITDKELNLNLLESLFFGFNEQIDVKELTILPSSTTMLDLLVLADAFTSRGNARKAGFSTEIPNGFTVTGTKKKPIWIWKE